MKKHNMTMSSIRLRGHQALLSALGPVGFVRFMQQFVSRGNYTRDRAKWIDQLDTSELELRAARVSNGHRRRVG